MGAASLVKIPICKWLTYRMFYATVGFDTAAAANPSWGSYSKRAIMTILSLLLQNYGNPYYDIDFWLDDKNGTVTVGEVWLPRSPSRRRGWVQIPRYSFDGLNYEEVKE